MLMQVVLLLGLSAASAAENIIWQPVHRYFIHRQAASMPVEGTKRLNSFTSYTHLGTDFGFHGPAQHEIEWVNDSEVRIRLSQQPDAWAGMWHSLAGLAVEPDRVLDFTRAFPAALSKRHQPRITRLKVDAAGRGKLKVELKNAAGAALLERLLPLGEKPPSMHEIELRAEDFRAAKMLLWTVEPGSDATVRGLWLGVDTPPLDWDEQVFATSYAKLLRCHNPASGLARDRAHLAEGSFESIPVTGLLVLATAAAAQAPAALVTPEFARAMLRQTHASLMRVKRPRGLLPHFVRQVGAEHEILPHTEYSTIDTALCLQSMLLAARILKDHDVESETLTNIRQIDFPALRLPSGHYTHGLDASGTRMLPHGWADWGGETALVTLLARLASPQSRAAITPSTHPGNAWQGTGFITEIQSLLHPDFDLDEPDATDGVRWSSVRRRMQAAQSSFFPKTKPSSLAARLGIYGLSAGENATGNAYYVGGTELPDQQLIHPHYMLMSAAISEQPTRVLSTLRHMQDAGFFPPWGMVENLSADGSSYLPMNGGLNAAFEALGAYHLLTQQRKLPNAIYQASRDCPQVREAMQAFYPQRP
ncbi:MAG: hypothetical protein IPK32_05365 [Verrucomicrobiaceae bacterium]|nr:hypothetical protein [Verrucomicrobiaceae bacterium]